MPDKRFLNSDDVAQILECSKSHAYKLIRIMNNELKEKGFITSAGKVSVKYFNERVYGLGDS